MMKIAASVAALAIAASVPAKVAAKELAEQYLDGEVSLSTEFTYDGPPITLTYSTFLGSAGATPELFLRAWDRLKEDTNGKITIQPYWSNSIADAQTGGFESVASGIVDMGTCYTQLNPGGFDLHFGVQLPGMFSESSVGSLVFNQVYAEFLRETYEKRGVYLARVGLTGPQQLYSKSPITQFEEMRGLRAWSVGKVANMAVAGLGLEPVSLKISELYPGFQTGVLDVVPMHDAGAILFRINEIATSRTPVDLWTNPNEHCINRQKWDSLPQEVQDYLYHWFQVWTQVESQLYYDDAAEEARQILKDEGLEFVELSEEDQGKIDKAYESVIENWISDQEAAGRAGRAMVDRMLELREEFRSMSRDERMQMVLESPIPGLMPGR